MSRLMEVPAPGKILFSLSRPPTGAYTGEDDLPHYLEQQFPPTARPRWRVSIIVLEGGFYPPAVLQDIILGVAQRTQDDSFGHTALVFVSSDDAMVDALNVLAAKHEIPLFVLPSMNAAPSAARPLGALTPTDVETLASIGSAGGLVKGIDAANLLGIKTNAALNRLGGLEKKGYVFRVSQPGREGDTFVYILAAADRKPTGALLRSAAPDSSKADIHEDVQTEIDALAEAEERGKILVTRILEGPGMLTTDEFAKKLGLSRQAVLDKRARGELLGLHGIKESFRFPVWQLADDDQPLPGLAELFRLLQNDEWAVFRFLKQHHPELGGRTALEELKNGHVGRVLSAAENAARAMS